MAFSVFAEYDEYEKIYVKIEHDEIQTNTTLFLPSLLNWNKRNCKFSLKGRTVYLLIHVDANLIKDLAN